MNKKRIIFYENILNWKNLARDFKNSENILFIQLDELRSYKSTFQRFLENELSTIPILKTFFATNTLNSLFKRLINLIIRRLRLNKNDLTQINYPDKINFNTKLMSSYIDADIYEKSDKMSVELFNSIKRKEVIKQLFNFSNYNLYETNRLEIVEEYNNLLLIFFSIIKIIEKELPSQIIIHSSVSTTNRIIIHSIAKKYKVFLIQEKKTLIKKRLNLSRYRLLIERIWYWNLWNVLNRHCTYTNKVKMSERLNIVFAHYKNHFPALIQVLKCFSGSENILNVIYTPHKLVRYAKELIYRNKVKNVVIIPHFDKNYRQFSEYYNQFRNLIKELNTSKNFLDVFVEGISISNLIRFSFLRLHEKFLNSFRYLINISNVFGRFKPAIITLLSGNDAIDVLATRIAKCKNIISLFFPHALYSIRRDHTAFEQDYVICAGEKDREYFTSLGTEQTKMTILGLPLYDKLYKKYAEITNYRDIKHKIQTQFKIDSSQKIIILVTTPDEDFIRETVFKSVVEITENTKEYALIIKIHPIEDMDYYHKLGEKYNVTNAIIIKEANLHDLLIASDLIIGRSSGAQIEAILLNKSVIDISYEAKSGRQLMEKFNAVIPVYDPRDLQNAIKNCLYNEEIVNSLEEGRKKYRNYAIYKFDGKASIRIKQLIEKILN